MFKDKPLKKIIGDKRVTIDALHQGISNEFITKKSQYEESLKEKEYLLQTHSTNLTEEIMEKISMHEKIIKECLCSCLGSWQDPLCFTDDFQ